MSKTAQVVSIFGDKMRRIARSDGYMNLVTALGTGRDKMSFNRFVRGAVLDVETLDALYSQNDMAARICDVVPDEELRQGYDIVVAPDAKTATGEAIKDASSMSSDVHDAADALHLTQKMIEARVWGRLFGGGAMLLGADDGATVENRRLVEPLNESAIASFDHINVLDRRYVHPITFYTDPNEAKLGRAKTYLVTPQASQSISAAQLIQGTIEIHETRLVVFGGSRTTIRTRQEHSGWDASILDRIETVLTQYGVSWDALAHMLQDASQGVFKMKGFIDALAAEETGLVMQRLDMLDMARSIVRAVVLDEDGESFERQNFNWSGIKEPFQLFMLRLSSAARMPATILMSQSPAGMDATGESDIRWFYDTIRSSQQNEVKPALEYVLRLLMLSKDGPTSGKLPESWSITFPSLWQTTPSEQANIEKTTAEKDAIEINAGIVTAEEVAVSRHTPDGWRPETMINLEERHAILEADLDLDIEDTPTLDPDGNEIDPEGMPSEDVQKQALAGGQTAQLIDLATKVQSGALSQESGVAIALVSNPGLEADEAAAIVGELDPEKAAAREAMANALSGGGGQPAGSGGDDDPDPEADPEADPDSENTGHEDDPDPEVDNEDHFDRIERRGSKYVLISKAGKVLGTHTSRKKAEEQERVIVEKQNG